MKPKNIIIGNSKIGINLKPFLVAEISANHGGTLERALETILQAKKSGADAIKIQSYTPDTMTINSTNKEFRISKGLWKGKTLYDLYKIAHTPFEWHKEIFAYARKIGITCFSTPFDISAVDLLDSLNTPAYKIASFEITDLNLIKYVAKKKKPIIISTGMANLQEIKDAVEVCKKNGNKKIIILHCVSSYPALIEQSNISTIVDLFKKFNLNIGLSDHTLSNSVSIASIALGACMIEKHFTIDKSTISPDNKFSLLPNEFKKLSLSINEAWKSIGRVNYKLLPSEKQNIIFRRSIYFVKDIRKNEIIKKEHIRIIRPGFGVAPKNYDYIIGKKVKKNISRGTAFNFKYIYEK